MSSSSSSALNNNKLTDRLYKKETNNINNINNNDNIKRNVIGLKPRMMSSASAPVLRNLPSTQQLDDNKFKTLDKSKVATGTGVISTSSSAQLLLLNSSSSNKNLMTIGSRPGILYYIISSYLYLLLLSLIILIFIRYRWIIFSIKWTIFRING